MTRATRRTLLSFAAAAVPLPALAQGTRTAAPKLAIVAFDTAGHLDESGNSWQVPSEIWAYHPQNSSSRKAFIAQLFSAKYGLKVTDANRAVFDRRVNLLLADNIGNVKPVVRVAASAPEYPATGDNGHTATTFRLPVSADAPAGGVRIPLQVDGAAAASVHLVPAEGISVISDIDDTVKDSHVLDKKRLWEATFYQPFKSVPGMAELVKRLAGPAGAVHYVSSTPWHLYTPLREWLATDGFPVSSLHLKQIRLKDTTVFNIFKGPEVMKPPVIEALVRRWPKRTFILLGDSGEKDPEIYGDIARKFPTQVSRILIRRAPGDASAASRFTQTFTGIERSRWQIFDRTDEIKI